MVIISYSANEFLGGGISVLIMFTLVSLFLAIYFSYIHNKQKEKYEGATHNGMNFKVPKSIENILLISFCWFMFIVSSYMSLMFILETGELGDNTAYIMTTLYTFVLVVIFLTLLLKYRELFTDKLKEWGFL